MSKLAIDILKQRTNELAKPRSTGLDLGIQLEYLIFEMDNTLYAIETQHVNKVLNIDHIFTLPGLPPFILGIINDGGKIISINDGSQIFDLPKIEIQPPYKILILKNQTLEIGLLVESVIRIQKIVKNDISTEIMSERHHTGFHVGLTRDHILILDGDLMLKTPRLIIDQSVNP